MLVCGSVSQYTRVASWGQALFEVNLPIEVRKTAMEVRQTLTGSFPGLWDHSGVLRAHFCATLGNLPQEVGVFFLGDTPPF